MGAVSLKAVFLPSLSSICQVYPGVQVSVLFLTELLACDRHRRVPLTAHRLNRRLMAHPQCIHIAGSHPPSRRFAGTGGPQVFYKVQALTDKSAGVIGRQSLVVTLALWCSLRGRDKKTVLSRG